MLTFVCIARIVSRDHASRVTHVAQVRWEENVVDNEHLGQPPHPSPQLSRHVLVEFGPGSRAKVFCCPPHAHMHKVDFDAPFAANHKGKVDVDAVWSRPAQEQKVLHFHEAQVRVCACACVRVCACVFCDVS